MGTAERRHGIMKTLCRYRYKTMPDLALEFGVSMRTIQRDIEVLSRTEPIYTQFGRHGGVYVVDGYSMNRMYMTDTEINVLQKLYIAADENVALLTNDEKNVLGLIISQYSKPKSKKDERKTL